MTVGVEVHTSEPDAVSRTLKGWERGNILERMWAKDPTVWADPPMPEIADRLGWLDAPQRSQDLVGTIDDLHEAAVADGIRDIVLCGMGGSSLAPEVFDKTLPSDSRSPRLTVIDSTHPGAIRAVDTATDPVTTWYVIASKSGGTIETMSLFSHFWEHAQRTLNDPGRHFIAITDPGTSLEELATKRGFRAVVLADPNVGGRYSALTAFGLVPAGLTGRDVKGLLSSGLSGAAQCGPSAPLAENPGFQIGSLLADGALRGSDKAQFVCTAPTESLGIWIEQLIAESTGKSGLGIVPIDGGPEPEGHPDATVVAIGANPHDGDIAMRVDEPCDVGAAMFILEFATAVAGEALGINPFDQPDVQQAKKLSAAALAGELATEGAVPIPVNDGGWAEVLRAALDDPSYVSVQAYVPQNASNLATLDRIRDQLTKLSGAYTTIGIGPRFLHSTGQLHKGGPSGGVFLQIVDDTGDAVRIPGTETTFNELIAAQAAGDRAALTNQGRTVIAVNIGTEDLTSILNHL